MNMKFGAEKNLLLAIASSLIALGATLPAYSQQAGGAGGAAAAGAAAGRPAAAQPAMPPTAQGAVPYNPNSNPNPNPTSTSNPDINSPVDQVITQNNVNPNSNPGANPTPVIEEGSVQNNPNVAGGATNGLPVTTGTAAGTTLGTTAAQAAGPGSPIAIQRLFVSLDSTKKGYLSEANVSSNHFLSTNFQACDTNADSRLTPAEVSNCMQNAPAGEQ